MTPDPDVRSWVPVPEGSDFPIQNLPYGVFRDGTGTRCGMAIGDAVFDLARAEAAGLFENLGLERDTFRRTSLNRFLSHSRGVWTQVRARVAELLDASSPAARAICDKHHLVVDHPVQMLLPIEVGDFVDFYSSEQHATNVGKMFRPGGEPLLENWRHLPVGYHGRAGTVIPSGAPVPRPFGQRRGDDGPTFGPTRALDYELEVGFVTGPGLERGTEIPVEEAEHHIFGMVLVDDWSARDIQAWEYVPLGPFLGKSFATTISPWVVPLEALEPFRSPPPRQEPDPPGYLTHPDRRGIDIGLRVSLTTARSTEPTITCETSFRTMYWTMDQQLAHATSNGATIRPGDLFASGTVSGARPEEFGSLLERTWNGSEPITLSDGSTRTFLEDGDTVTITGRCEADGQVPIGFGLCQGTITA